MPEPDVATLTHRLAAITRRAIGDRMATESWAHDAGFRPGCIGVLRVVAAREPVSQREVSEALLLDPSDLVTLVDILEAAGLVERRRDPADRRRYALEVTPRGQLAVVRLREINRETNEELLAPLDEQERAQLAELIGRVVRHHTGEPDPATGGAASGADGRPDPAERAGAPSGRTGSAGRTVATARSEADEDGVREVPVMPGHPERTREPYDPDREAERARRHAAESLRP
jgi:MarR family transcriptional regulator, lower aerobic nicotinate degradation pathway regulator